MATMWRYLCEGLVFDLFRIAANISASVADYWSLFYFMLFGGGGGESLVCVSQPRFNIFPNSQQLGLVNLISNLIQNINIWVEREDKIVWWLPKDGCFFIKYYFAE